MKFLYFSFLAFIGGIANAQNNYWQQRVDNKIEVSLDDVRHILRGQIDIDYYNNSPDTLTYIFFHVYPNAYSNDRTAYTQQTVENKNTEFYFSKEEDKGYIDSLSFVVTQEGGVDEKAGIVYTRNDDVIKLILPKPLLPGKKLTISSPFKVKLPKTFSRLGHRGQTYQISQWYPKPAVYDATGWHPMPYLDQGEFYSEFGSYDVSITLPDNYIVMATGNLQNEIEEKWLDSLAKLPLPEIERKDSVKRNATVKLKTLSPIKSSSNLKTLRFTEDNIHDFAWFANKRWVVRKDTVLVPENGNLVTAFTCFSPLSQSGWATSVNALKIAVKGYSKAVGAYPYKTVKAVEGPMGAGGGMEYPTVTIISAGNDTNSVNTTIIHEVGHNWFYGILGSNERLYPWMDESINSFYEHQLAVYPSSFGKRIQVNEMDLSYRSVASFHKAVPVATPAADMPWINYGTDIYAKGPLYVKWLAGYMGKDTFDAAMRDYFETWKFKHPQPKDFAAIMQKHTTKSLDWFFGSAMEQEKGVDFALGKVTSKGVVVKNRSGFLAPVAVFYKNGTDSGTVWSQPFTGKQTVALPEGEKYEVLKISSEIPDYVARNDARTAPLSLKPFLGFNTQSKTKLWFSPAIGYNYYDGFMAGALVHNLTVPQNKFQFALAPLYAFGSKSVTGTGFLSYTKFLDDGALHNIFFNLEGKSFALGKSNFNIDNYLHTRFIKVAPEVVFNFRKTDYRSTVNRSLSLKAYWIREGSFDYIRDSIDQLFRPSIGKNVDNFYGRVQYNHNNSRTFNPFNYKFEAQAGKEFAKVSAEFKARIDYHIKKKSLYVRAYLGKFFDFSDNVYDAYRYRLATTYSGWNDYLYDETYGGRNVQQGFWSQQISMKEGGFKINTLQYSSQLGLSDNMLFAVNLKTDLPYTKLPVRIYADIATFSGAKRLNPSAAGLVYGAGLEIYLADYVNIYLPLFNSADYSEYTKSVYPTRRFLRSIAFSINIGEIKWTQLPQMLLSL